MEPKKISRDLRVRLGLFFIVYYSRKYIRTEDGVYELESTYEHLGKTYYGIKRRISTFTEEEIIATSDTLEELIQSGDLVKMESTLHPRPVTTDIEVSKVSYTENGIKLSTP